MTREEAIERLNNIWIRDALQEDYDALHMAIRALSAIEDIKAEIADLPSELTEDGRRMIRRGSVFRIIDKHISGKESKR